MVFGPYRRMDVVTSRIAGRKIRKKPETIAGRISGSVISVRLSVWEAPQTRAASSSEEWTCSRAALEVFMEKDR